MCVQPNAVRGKAIPYMVLYCLTPPRFHRYSSLTLCVPYPAWGVNNDAMVDARIALSAGGICLVNKPSRGARSQNPHPVAKNATRMGQPCDDWLLVPRSSRCSN